MKSKARQQSREQYFICSGERNRKKVKIKMKYSLKVTLRNVLQTVQRAFVFLNKRFENTL